MSLSGVPVAQAVAGDVATKTTKTVIQNPDGVPVTPQPAVPVAGDVPTGGWRHGLFECFDACGDLMFWMSIYCPYIAMGQLLQRMKMNVCGQPGDHKNTCVIWTVAWAAAVVLWIIVGWSTRGVGYVFYLNVFYLMFVILALAALTQVRHFMRQRWSIPADCCEGNGCLSDCCSVWLCTSCSVIQMLRHTHDEKVHLYKFTSPTGLEDDAPEVV